MIPIRVCRLCRLFIVFVVSRVSSVTIPARWHKSLDVVAGSGDVKSLQTTPQVLLTHLGHEGSHAICHGFMTNCIKANCSEYFDYYHNDGKIPWEKVRLNGGVTLLDTQEVFPRTDAYDPVVIVLFRTNLMEYALSQYYKWRNSRAGRDNDGSAAFDPQFQPGYVPDAAYYDPTEVHTNAKIIVEQWNARIEFLNELRHQGSPYSIVEYERFDKDPDGYLRRLVKAVGYEEVPEGQTCELQEDYSGDVSGGAVHDAHPAGWEQYVTNYAEIKRSFDAAGYPSLNELYGGHVSHLVE